MYFAATVYLALISYAVIVVIVSVFTGINPSVKREKATLKLFAHAYKTEIIKIAILGVLPVIVLFYFSATPKIFFGKVNNFMSGVEVISTFGVLYLLSLIFIRINKTMKSKRIDKYIKLLSEPIKGPFYALSGFFIVSSTIGLFVDEHNINSLKLYSTLLAVGLFYTCFIAFLESSKYEIKDIEMTSTKEMANK